MANLDRDDVLQCRNWRMGTCERSDPVVLQEDAMHTQLGCRTCRCGWVVTMPQGRAKARYESRLDAIKEAERRRREHESRPILFT